MRRRSRRSSGSASRRWCWSRSPPPGARRALSRRRSSKPDASGRGRPPGLDVHPHLQAHGPLLEWARNDGQWAAMSPIARFAAALALLAPVAAQAEPTPYPEAEAQTLELTMETIALRSVQGEGNRTAEVAQVFRRALLAGGWAEGDVEIVPVDDTAYLIATWPGSDPSLGPVVISAHMDVVEARPEDWQRDPFTPVIENGYIYGRGASDTKFEASLVVASLIELRRQGFRPRRSIVVAYSGDEETTMKTSRLIAERLRNAHIVLNVDGASGLADEKTGAPLYWTWQGAEKTYIDFRLEATNAGGHSSTPRPDNAIAQLAQAVGRIAAYRFKPEINDIT